MRRWSVLIASTVLCLAARSHGQAPTDRVVVESILTGLSNPCGVAVRPAESVDRYEVFVADSGARRVIRVWSNDPKDETDVVSGFSLATLRESELQVGPIGLYFLDRTHLIVGASGSDGASVQLFELADQLKPMSTDHANQQVLFSSDEGNRNHVYSIARTRANDAVSDALVLACFSNDHAGDLRKIAVRAGTLAELQPFAARRYESATDSPAAVAVGEGGYVVVGWIGSLKSPADSRLEFYNPINGARLMELSTELYDVVGLAYSPKSGNLYAADIAWMDPSKGGVYRIDDASEPGAAKCTATRIAEVQRPSALAFGPDGALYVTAFDDTKNDAPQGMLLRITGDL